MGFKMICQNPQCKKKYGLMFKLKSGYYVCESCAYLSGMSKEEIEDIKQESEVNQ